MARPAMSAPAGLSLAWAVPILVELAALLRSVVLAWGLGAEDLGRAMVLALVLRLAEMATDLGVDRYLAVTAAKAQPGLLAALQGAQLLRGVAAALVLLALLPVARTLFPDGAGVGALASLALVPLARGFLHLDYRLAEAQRRFGPLAIVEGLAALMALAALPMVVAVFGDARAMAALLVLQALAQVILSHLVAERPYALRFDRAVLARLWQFGLPLVGNAGLMFLSLQADRLIVAHHFGWAEVAAYGVAFQLASLPAQVAGRAAGSLWTAGMAQASDTGAMRRALLSFAALAAAFAFGFAVLAPAVIALVYGPALAPQPMLALALGVSAGLRILRTPFSVQAVACGRTGAVLAANLWRAAFLLVAWAAAAAGLPIWAVALAGAAGEAAAALRAALGLRAHQHHLTRLAQGMI